MILNYFKIAWRNFLKDRLYSIINLTGFTIGLTVCLLIILYVSDELSYDRFHINSDRIYRLEMDQIEGSTITRKIRVPALLGGELKKQFPEVEAHTILGNRGSLELGKERIEAKGFIANTQSLDVFTFPLIYGDNKTALDEPDEIVISESIANQFFPNQNPVGRDIPSSSLSNDGSSRAYKVGGVMKDMPRQSHFHADLLRFEKEEEGKLDFMGYSSIIQYVLLAENADPNTLIAKFEAKGKDYNLPESIKLRLRPLHSIHLDSNTAEEIEVNGSRAYVSSFALAAILLLLLGCINFINLLTARSLRRAKEVGVRKTLGAARKQLALQFFCESFLYVIIAIVLAFVAAQIILPAFNQLLNKELQISNLLTNSGWIFFGVVLLTGFLSGAYPSIYLSGFSPSFALRNMVKGSARERGFRNGLVVFQFAISVVLIVSTLVIYQQLNFISNKKLGFNSENLVLLPNTKMEDASASAFKNQLIQNSEITDVSFASWVPGTTIGWIGTFKDSTMAERTEIRYVSTDQHFAKAAGLNLLEGDFFEKTSSSLQEKTTNEDQQENKEQQPEPIVLNEAAVEKLGLKDPIGKVLISGVQGKVIGVVENFHERSLHHEIGAVVFKYSDNPYFEKTLIRLKGNRTAQTLEDIQAAWKTHFHNSVFKFEFAEDKLQQQYVQEAQLGKLFLAFAVLAILVANLGLLGMIVFAAQQRTKEIGVRKVMGATIFNIVQLLSKDFVKLVLGAIIIAIPVGWYIMNKWLENFAFRIDMSWTLFGVAALMAIVIALLIVSWQALKAAVANPVSSLRNE